ncbi:MAG TPA: hypothetical protein VFN92_07540 [Solirubrobacterales bacterium]|nr:hypothetical protein [Solirubrobacterales bacterium]
MTSPKIDLDRLQAEIEERSSLCPNCRHGDFFLGKPIALQGLDNLGIEATPGKGFRAIPVVCTHCGLMKLHNVGVLMGQASDLDEEEPDDDADAEGGNEEIGQSTSDAQEGRKGP